MRSGRSLNFTPLHVSGNDFFRSTLLWHRSPCPDHKRAEIPTNEVRHEASSLGTPIAGIVHTRKLKARKTGWKEIAHSEVLWGERGSSILRRNSHSAAVLYSVAQSATQNDAFLLCRAFTTGQRSVHMSRAESCSRHCHKREKCLPTAFSRCS